MARRRALGALVCPPALIRFDPVDWPASAADLAQLGDGQHSAFYAWLRWAHARADFAESRGMHFDAIPEDVPAEAWAAVLASLG